MSAKRQRRILYIDETSGFGGSTVGLRQLILGLDPQRYSAAVAIRASNREAWKYLRENLPPCVRLFPIRRWDSTALDPYAAVAERILTWAFGGGGRSIAGRARWLVGALLEVIPAAGEMATVARGWGAHAVHTGEQITSNVAGILAARLAGIPCFSHNKMVGFSRGLLRRLMPYVTHCFAASRYVQQHMVQNGIPESMITVAYDGIDAKAFGARAGRESVRRELGLPLNKTVLGLFARMVPWKGHRFFLQALAEAAKKDASLMGLVVGDTSPPGGRLARELKNLARVLGLSERVRFLGYRTDVARLMSAVDIVVVPSLEPDPFPVVNLEALAMSRPVIATRVGGIPELIDDGENGLLVSVGDAEEFARAILRLSADRGLAQRLGARGHQIVLERFGPTACADVVSRVYEQFLQG